ncbi:MAG: hypothetical protein AB7F59_01765 [Bdellovibrionales bacterium]
MSKSLWSHLLLGVLLFVFSSLGLGYRHLWQDEIETAERARAILQTGFPQVILSEEDVSLNAHGRELEEGSLHRYSPWGQFYWGATGLAIGPHLGFSRDQSVREPFVFAHAATSTILSYGLAQLAGVPLPLALVVGATYGLQTTRLLHHRTSRYHALLDLFAALGILALGFCRRNQKRGWSILAIVIFLAPQVHTLGGSLLAALLGIMSLCVLMLKEKSQREWKTWVLFCVLPGLITLITLLGLTRPWAQGAWGTMTGEHLFRSITNKSFVRYALDYTLVATLFAVVFKKRQLAAVLCVLMISAYLLTGALDAHPFSQARYYLYLPTFFLFWNIVFQPFMVTQKKFQWAHGLVILIFILGPDLTTRQFSAFQGLKVVWNDFQKARSQEKQPLHLALEEIRTEQKPVLIDYVPQFVNWYLPGWPQALLPDATQRTELNHSNPIWQKPPVMPYWHLWYSSWESGGWVCMPHCDYVADEWNEERTQYKLTSQRLGESQKMCVVREWSTNPWNNAPFELMLPESFTPRGRADGRLTLAKVCP